jgi:hypothetical protein
LIKPVNSLECRLERFDFPPVFPFQFILEDRFIKIPLQGISVFFALGDSFNSIDELVQVPQRNAFRVMPTETAAFLIPENTAGESLPADVWEVELTPSSTGYRIVVSS